jgi:hypothetical protein
VYVYRTVKVYQGILFAVKLKLKYRANPVFMPGKLPIHIC